MRIRGNLSISPKHVVLPAFLLVAILFFPWSGSLASQVSGASVPLIVSSPFLSPTSPISQPSANTPTQPSYGILSSASPNSLTIAPHSGPAGTSAGIIGEGFPPSTEIDLYWSTMNGTWVMSGHDFLGSKMSTQNNLLVSTQSNELGQFNVSVKVPYDYGGNHNIKAVMRYANGSSSSPLAQTLFTLLPSFQVSSTSGPAGTPIMIRATGLGYGLYSTDYHVLWDNNYAGYITAISTRGNATFTITAVGAAGDHYVDIYEGYPGPAYLNIQQSPPSPQYYSPPLIPFHAVFTITPSVVQADQATAGLLAGVSVVAVFASVIVAAILSVTGRRHIGYGPSKTILAFVIIALLLAGASFYLSSFPASDAQAVPTSSVVQPPIDMTAALSSFGAHLSNQSTTALLSASPSIVTVGSQLVVTGSGFAPHANLQLEWSTMKGSYLRGWNTTLRPLESVTTNSQGGFSSNITVPHDLEGIHEIMIANDSNAGTAFVYITRSATISPLEGPAGTVIEINMTGVGWTFATNTATIVYDNSFVGYVCGFNSMGDVTAWVKAVGSPGIHTIDIYPTLYAGPNNTNAEYRYPLLDPQDHPAHSAVFHFEFVITQQQQSSSNLASPQDISAMTLVFGFAFLIVQSPMVTMRASGREIRQKEN